MAEAPAPKPLDLLTHLSCWAREVLIKQFNMEWNEDESGWGWKGAPNEESRGLNFTQAPCGNLERGVCGPGFPLDFHQEHRPVSLGWLSGDKGASQRMGRGRMASGRQQASCPCLSLP